MCALELSHEYFCLMSQCIMPLNIFPVGYFNSHFILFNFFPMNLWSLDEIGWWKWQCVIWIMSLNVKYIEPCVLLWNSYSWQMFVLVYSVLSADELNYIILSVFKSNFLLFFLNHLICMMCKSFLLIISLIGHAVADVRKFFSQCDPGK